MRRPKPHRTGIRPLALTTLFFAVVLLLGHRAGGSQAADALLSRLAASEDFITHTFSFETGTQQPEFSASVPLPVIAESNFPQAEIEQPAIPLPNRPVKRAQTIKMNNESGLTADPTLMLQTPLSVDCSGDQPTVLIYHTHATEAYTPTNLDSYTPSGDYRTTNTNQNVVRVGAELKKILESHSIQVIHLTTLFDHPSYNGSYGLSLAAMRKVLEEYPTIQVTIDIHRDAVIQSDGSQYRTEVTIDEQSVAQLMLVVGTNASGLEHPNWKQNLNFAANLQADLEGTYPGLMRPIYLRRQRFNEHLVPAGMLLEVGSSGNTLQEALRAVRLFGEGLVPRLLPDV